MKRCEHCEGQTVGRIQEFTWNGVEHRAPEIWIAGFCSPGSAGNSRPFEDALRWWVYQCELAQLDAVNA